jgi:hypothetical protein
MLAESLRLLPERPADSEEEHRFPGDHGDEVQDLAHARRCPRKLRRIDRTIPAYPSPAGPAIFTMSL